MHQALSQPSAWIRPAVLAFVLICLGGCSDDDDDRDRYAEIRLLNVSPDYRSLDLYVTAEGGNNDVMKVQDVAFETVSPYRKADSYVYDVKLKRNGVNGTLRTLGGEKQADGAHLTYIAFGSTGNLGIMKLNDDQTAANDNRAKLQVFNAADAGPLDIYLTDESVSLDDGEPLFGALASGASTGIAFLDSRTYRLRVVGTNDTSDLRLDLSGVTLASRQVMSLVLTATPGGVLVGAVFIPQRGELAIKHNTKARVRGAVGVDSGVNASIGGVTLLTGAGAGVISSRYSQIEAGSVAVDLKVGGVAVPVANQQLAAGGDYTLLVWSNAQGQQLAVIGDDNRLPSAGKAKLRVMNGRSGDARSVTMAVDFSPVAEGIAAGQISGYTEFGSTAEYQLDLSDTETATTLVTKTSVALANGGVYTLLASGSGTVSGTLRKDR
ncbi:MAG: DUF4397 domain-containing protein [Steroidobacteraceae bacterium]